MGVDIYLTARDQRWIVIQCKNALRGISLPTINAEILKAEKLGVSIKEFWIATTARSDGQIQREMGRVSEERVNQGKFPVDVLFWDDLHDLLCSDDAALKKHGYLATGKTYEARERDRKRFAEFERALQYPNVVRILAQHDFRMPVPLAPVVVLDRFLESWNTIATDFYDTELKSHFRSLFRAAYRFNDALDNCCSPYGTDSIWVLPAHIRQRLNREDMEDVKRLNLRRQHFIVAYETLIKQARRKLY